MPHWQLCTRATLLQRGLAFNTPQWSNNWALKERSGRWLDLLCNRFRLLKSSITDYIFPMPLISIFGISSLHYALCLMYITGTNWAFKSKGKAQVECKCLVILYIFLNPIMGIVHYIHFTLSGMNEPKWFFKMASGLFFPHSFSFKRIMVYYAYIFSVALHNNLTFAYIIIIIRITYFSHVKGFF